MELKDFITQTLININQGIIDAQEQTKDSDIKINPKNFKQDKYNNYIQYNGAPPTVQEIEFNVVVNVSEGNDSKIAVGVFSGFVSGGASNTDKTNNSTQSTIKFTLPIQFPSDDYFKKYT